jgi:hypothetical protein
MSNISEQINRLIDYTHISTYDRESEINRLRLTQHVNPLARYGKKCFSQVYEDGITIEIIERIKRHLRSKFFLEIGSGNGHENNTTIAAALKWEGVWVDQCDLAYDLPESSRVKYYQQKVNKHTAVQLAKQGLRDCGKEAYDMISIDVDGIDYYIIEELLNNELHPLFWIVEYNAQFPPPVEYIIDYDPDFTWDNSFNFGASLQSINNLMQSFGYMLVCCTPSAGTNAFYVSKELAYLFKDVPEHIGDIYVEPHYRLSINFGHNWSPAAVKKVLSKAD